MGDLVLIGRSDKTAVLFKVDSQQGTLQEVQRLSFHEGSVNAVAFNQSGDRFATASTDGSAAIWKIDVARRKPSDRRPEGVVFHKAYVNGVAFSPDGKQLVTCSDDGTARLWDVKTHKVLGPPMRHADHRAIRSIAYDPEPPPNSHRIATGGLDGVVRLWTFPLKDLSAGAAADPNAAAKDIAKATGLETGVLGGDGPNASSNASQNDEPPDRLRA